ncbi:MAG: DOMON-like domain-containing protein [Proteobacteria bacterium]|nr:DOMON-like domain-containing protein [Pseudomonadota bacterium]
MAARAETAEPGSLRLQYVLEADLGRVRLPPPAPGAGRADRLWAHTCFEAFIGRADSPHYLELNFSPSGEWAAYRFESYRQAMAPVELPQPPRLAVRGDEDRLELEAEVHLRGVLPGLGGAAMSAGAGNGGLRIALSTVVEDRDGGLSYWALRHPAGRPDFHHPESFTLELALPWNPAP